MTARYFYDTEFIDDGRTIDLISIGIACEDGREYYAVNAAVGDSLNSSDLGSRIQRHDWLMENVVPHLPLYQPQKRFEGKWMAPFLDMKSTQVRPKWVIANEVREFLLCDIPKDTDIELWADYAAYDHVALAQLWGPMIRLPQGVPMWTNDIQTYARIAGISPKNLPHGPGTEHHALADARRVWSRYTYIRDARQAKDDCGVCDQRKRNDEALTEQWKNEFLQRHGLANGGRVVDVTEEAIQARLPEDE